MHGANKQASHDRKTEGCSPLGGAPYKLAKVGRIFILHSCVKSYVVCSKTACVFVALKQLVVLIFLHYSSKCSGDAHGNILTHACAQPTC